MTERIPKLDFDALPERIATLLEPKYRRLGYLGEFFARTAHQPDALAAFIEFTDAAKGGLDDRVVELIALTVATLQDVAYERHQHERLSVRLGFGRDWVAAVERLEPESALDDPAERVVQRFVIDAVRSAGHEAGPPLEGVADALGHRDAVAAMMVLARYYAHALMVNAMGIAAPVPSIFEDGFDGDAPSRASGGP